MKKFIQSIIDHQVKKYPFINITKNSFQWVGMGLGGMYGFKESLRNENGVFWRPSLGVVVGGCVGFTAGLFPFHVFGLLLSGDLVYTGLYGSYGSYRSNISYRSNGASEIMGMNEKKE
jgi:hypothetical protein